MWKLNGSKKLVDIDRTISQMQSSWARETESGGQGGREGFDQTLAARRKKA
jgi:hypothetical protein